MCPRPAEFQGQSWPWGAKMSEAGILRREIGMLTTLHLSTTLPRCQLETSCPLQDPRQIPWPPSHVANPSGGLIIFRTHGSPMTVLFQHINCSVSSTASLLPSQAIICHQGWCLWVGSPKPPQSWGREAVSSPEADLHLVGLLCSLISLLKPLPVHQHLRAFFSSSIQGIPWLQLTQDLRKISSILVSYEVFCHKKIPSLSKTMEAVIIK